MAGTHHPFYFALGAFLIQALPANALSPAAFPRPPVAADFRTTPPPDAVSPEASGLDPGDPLEAAALADEARFDAAGALRLFLRDAKTRPNDSFLLQKISKQYSDLSEDAVAVAEKRRRLESALVYARRACALRPNDPVDVLSLAICYGKLGLYADRTTRVGYARLVKQYADQAVALDPRYAYAHHVLGRWNYEVAKLGRARRFFASVLYGGLPAASTAEAVRQLELAVKLAPDIPSHRLELGFALLANGQTREARKRFEEVLSMPPRERYDDAGKRRAREALAGPSG